MSSVKKEILSQEITRKQFVTIMVGGVVAVFGFNNLLAFITGVTNPHHANHDASGRHGFGASKFGV